MRNCIEKLMCESCTVTMLSIRLLHSATVLHNYSYYTVSAASGTWNGISQKLRLIFSHFLLAMTYLYILLNMHTCQCPYAWVRVSGILVLFILLGHSIPINIQVARCCISDLIKRFLHSNLMKFFI